MRSLHLTVDSEASTSSTSRIRHSLAPLSLSQSVIIQSPSYTLQHHHHHHHHQPRPQLLALRSCSLNPARPLVPVPDVIRCYQELIVARPLAPVPDSPRCFDDIRCYQELSPARPLAPVPDSSRCFDVIRCYQELIDNKSRFRRPVPLPERHVEVVNSCWTKTDHGNLSCVP